MTTKMTTVDATLFRKLVERHGKKRAMRIIARRADVTLTEQEILFAVEAMEQINLVESGECTIYLQVANLRNLQTIDPKTTELTLDIQKIEEMTGLKVHQFVSLPGISQKVIPAIVAELKDQTKAPVNVDTFIQVIMTVAKNENLWANGATLRQVIHDVLFTGDIWNVTIKDAFYGLMTFAFGFDWKNLSSYDFSKPMIRLYIVPVSAVNKQNTGKERLVEQAFSQRPTILVMAWHKERNGYKVVRTIHTSVQPNVLVGASLIQLCTGSKFRSDIVNVIRTGKTIRFSDHLGFKVDPYYYNNHQELTFLFSEAITAYNGNTKLATQLKTGKEQLDQTNLQLATAVATDYTIR